jgi:uncharacterized protein YchJ
MRSRYGAFAVGDAGYLLRSWDPCAHLMAYCFEH